MFLIYMFMLPGQYAMRMQSEVDDLEQISKFRIVKVRPTLTYVYR